jgi:hypothetical protein
LNRHFQIKKEEYLKKGIPLKNILLRIRTLKISERSAFERKAIFFANNKEQKTFTYK